MPGLETYMTLEEAAARFGVKRDRLRRAAVERRLEATKVSARRTAAYLVTDDAMRAFLGGPGAKRGPKPKTAPAEEEAPPPVVETGGGGCRPA